MPATNPTLRSELQRTGIRRTGGPRNGFRYRRVNGAAVTAAERERIAGLRIPSGWREVVIASRPGARLQAVGQDAAGRWQYVYLARQAEKRARRKYDRLVAFARALPALRTALRRDLARSGMPFERVCAAAVLLLSVAALRPGSERYARENGTFGLATLRPEHVTIRGPIVRLVFRGKHGVTQRHTLRGDRLARLVRELLRLPGRELLKFQDAHGRVRDVRRAQLNDYLAHAMGARFTAKDFRTWCGTLMCAAELRRLLPDPRKAAPANGRASRRARRAAIARAIVVTARRLGNTAVATRRSYVHPALLEACLAGRVVTQVLDRPEVLAEKLPRGLHPAERALLRIIAGG
jgi:DNA topoisomerase-1